MTQETLQELLIEQLRDIYDAEKQLIKALPKMAKAAENEELAEAFRNHLSQTETQMSRLEEVFGILGVPAKGKTCKGMKGLLEEATEEMQKQDKGEMRDLAMIAGAQRVEHYEIAAYGTVRTIAEQMDLSDAVDLLQQTEEEEKETDEKLTDIAVTMYESVEGEEDEDEEEEEEEEEDQPAPSRSRGSAGGRSKNAS